MDRRSFCSTLFAPFLAIISLAKNNNWIYRPTKNDNGKIQYRIAVKPFMDFKKMIQGIEEINFEDIKKGDYVGLIEPDGTPVVDKNGIFFKRSLSDAYKINDKYNNWAFDC